MMRASLHKMSLLMKNSRRSLSCSLTDSCMQMSDRSVRSISSSSVFCSSGDSDSIYSLIFFLLGSSGVRSRSLRERLLERRRSRSRSLSRPPRSRDRLLLRFLRSRDRERDFRLLKSDGHYLASCRLHARIGERHSTLTTCTSDKNVL